MKSVLCIGGLDPAGRAGLLADAHAVRAMGCRPLCVATALTYQSSRRLDGYRACSADEVEKQLAPLLRDEEISAIKIGQLATPELAGVIARIGSAAPMVLDTPLVSSSGGLLFPSESVRDAYVPLLARASLVTPNVPEVFLLTGTAPSAVRSDVEAVARSINAAAVLLKGGHFEEQDATDVLLRGAHRVEFRSPRLAGRFRGTGCRLAAAIASRLAIGEDLSLAIARAREWLLSELRGEA